MESKLGEIKKQTIAPTEGFVEASGVIFSEVTIRIKEYCRQIDHSL
jgi:hypothetical protein